MKTKASIIVVTSILLLSGCFGIETIDVACQRKTDSFLQGIQCIKNGYGKAFSSGSPVKDEIDEEVDICGKEISSLITQGKIGDKQAWTLFWRVRQLSANFNSQPLVCIDVTYLKDAEKEYQSEQESRTRERIHTFNN